jgi:uncharacterized protein YxjI
MGLFRKGKDAQKRKFKMREDLMSFGDDFWIEDEHGDKAFHVNGKALRMRDTWVLEDAQGKELASMKKHSLGRDKIVIEIGGRTATVKKALVGIRDRFHVEVELGHDLKVHGQIGDHEYDIDRDGDKIAEVSKKWFRVRDTYGVEIEDDTDTVLVLAVTVAVDAMARG